MLCVERLYVDLLQMQKKQNKNTVTNFRLRLVDVTDIWVWVREGFGGFWRVWGHLRAVWGGYGTRFSRKMDKFPKPTRGAN